MAVQKKKAGTTRDSVNEIGKIAAGPAGSAAAGAATGAAAGSLFGPLGAAVGAVVGGVAGSKIAKSQSSKTHPSAKRTRTAKAKSPKKSHGSSRKH